MAKAKPTTIRIDASLLDALDKWILRQKVPPSRTSAIEAAIKLLIRK
jgi:metal-responsive CopG/Arc/MetJ family transcriptional regulator